MSKPGPNEACWCGSGKKYKKCHMHRDRIEHLNKPPESERPMPTVVKGRVSPMRSVPSHIVPPDYAISGKPGGSRGLRNIKGPDQIKRMRHACKMAREVLNECLAAAKPGVTTEELDIIAHEASIARNCYPSTLNYHHYPKSICTSVNEVICHGIPDDRKLVDGDIVNIDVTVYVDGMHGDNSAMALIGDVDEEGQKLVQVAYDSMLAGIAEVRPGAQLNRIGKAIETLAGQHGYGVVRAFVGHGIGELFHMEPQVAHYYDAKTRFELKEGMTFTIEPMINIGTWTHTSWDDDWTVVTSDLKRSAQWEHTVLVTADGVEVLTLADGEPQPLG